MLQLRTITTVESLINISLIIQLPSQESNCTSFNMTAYYTCFLAKPRMTYAVGSNRMIFEGVVCIRLFCQVHSATHPRGRLVVQKLGGGCTHVSFEVARVVNTCMYLI